MKKLLIAVLLLLPAIIFSQQDLKLWYNKPVKSSIGYTLSVQTEKGKWYELINSK